MYFAFLFLFTYVLLVDSAPPQGPSGSEVALTSGSSMLALEEIRQVSGGPGPVADGVRGLVVTARLQEGPRPRGGAPRPLAWAVCPARASSRMRTRAW